jgi:hypothetical protein
MPNSYENNPDYLYCKRLLDELKKIEKIRFARFQLKRNYDEDLAKRRSLLAILIALILPLVLLAFYFFSEYSILHNFNFIFDMRTLMTRTLGVLLICIFLYIASYIFVYKMWDHKILSPIKNLTIKSLLKQYEPIKLEINKRSNEILNKPEIKDNQIPVDYLSINMVNTLMRYFVNGQAVFLDEGLDMLEADISRAISHKSNLFEHENMVNAEKEYLANYKPNSINLSL